MMDISVIVVSYNTRALLADSLRSIQAERATLAVEIWVVDNASTDGSADLVAEQFPEVRLIRNVKNVGFAVANNQALQHASGQLLFLLNSDASLLPGSLITLQAAFVERPELGIAGPRLINPDGSWQPSWGDFPTPATELRFQLFLYLLWPGHFPYGRRVRPWMRSAYRKFRWVDWVTGAALIMRRAVYESVGGLPEDNFMYGEDLGFCARARRAGFNIAFLPSAAVCHHLQTSSRRDYTGWIENYTRAMLGYYQRYCSASDQRRAARWIIEGSRFRQVVWGAVSLVWPARRAEAQQRYIGYQRAAALADRILKTQGQI